MKPKDWMVVIVPICCSMLPMRASAQPVMTARQVVDMERAREADIRAEGRWGGGLSRMERKAIAVRMAVIQKKAQRRLAAVLARVQLARDQAFDAAIAERFRPATLSTFGEGRSQGGTAVSSNQRRSYGYSGLPDRNWDLNNSEATGSGSAAQETPTAQAVHGKRGIVVSPFASEQGYVDVRGLASGTEVRDPYTGKVFLVP